ncbi:unnamed protein product [Musa acuminata subsp. malaccensis]|uniref:(wild Malaysian banana) hypothetical protein n=1 Tax=Musa acuminata subsp. malaccensis TaxID=214687 RepID=A0A804JT33_MUSAM|nr:unnamed protein product [Musa acuminata subsp. malaccensis]
MTGRKLDVRYHVDLILEIDTFCVDPISAFCLSKSTFVPISSPLFSERDDHPTVPFEVRRRLRSRLMEVEPPGPLRYLIGAAIMMVGVVLPLGYMMFCIKRVPSSSSTYSKQTTKGLI